MYKVFDGRLQIDWVNNDVALLMEKHILEQYYPRMDNKEETYHLGLHKLKKGFKDKISHNLKE